MTVRRTVIARHEAIQKTPPLTPPKEGNRLRLGRCKFVKFLSRAYFPLFGGNKGGLSSCVSNSPSFGGGWGEVNIDISHLSNGMYFLKIDNKVFKVIKQ